MARKKGVFHDLRLMVLSEQTRWGKQPTRHGNGYVLSEQKMDFRPHFPHSFFSKERRSVVEKFYLL